MRSDRAFPILRWLPQPIGPIRATPVPGSDAAATRAASTGVAAFNEFAASDASSHTAVPLASTRCVGVCGTHAAAPQGGRAFEATGDVNSVLKTGLLQAGYTERSYYSVPNGFALVTRLERIERNGTPSSNRWAIGPSKLERFSLEAYLRALFTANPGHYRVIVFVVTDAPVTQSDQTLTRDEALKWLRSGAQSLPDEIAALPWNTQVTCTALIYEFIHEQQKDPRIQLPSEFDGMTHLTSAKLWTALGSSRRSL